MNFTLDSIQQFILQELLSPDNTLEVLDAPAVAADPLVGCAAGDDPRSISCPRTGWPRPEWRPRPASSAW